MGIITSSSLIPCQGIALLLLCIVVSFLGSCVDATCPKAVGFRFRPDTVPGTRSFISKPGTPVQVVENTVLAAVTLQVLDDTGKTYVRQKQMEVSVDLETPDGDAFEPSTQSVTFGEVTFENLVFKAKPKTTTRLIFTVKVADKSESVHNTQLVTGTVNYSPKSYTAVASELVFAGYNSFLLFTSQKRSVQKNVVMPRTAVRVLTPLGGEDTKYVGTAIVRSEDAACTTEGSETDFLNGIAAFTGLVIRGSCSTTRLIFSVKGVPGIGQVTSDTITLLTATAANSEMAFAPSPLSSVINSNNHPPVPVAVVGVVLPPIQINLQTSSFHDDTTNTGLIITATATKGRLSGDKVLVVNGVATFTELMFEDNPRSAEIYFTAGTQGKLDVAGKQLFSGSFRVDDTAVRNAFIRFDRESWITDDLLSPKWWVQGKAMPRVVIRMLDSSHLYDPSGNSANVVAACSGCRLENNVAPMSNGLASFTRLSIQDKPAGRTVQLTFSVENASIPVALEHRTITSTAISISTPAEATALSVGDQGWQGSVLQFGTAEESLIYNSKHTVFATVGVTLPVIVVDVKSVFGYRHQPSKLKMVAYVEAVQGDTVLSSPQVDGVNGRYRFSCIRFLRQPSGSTTIKFAILSTTQRIESGLVTVTGVATAAYSARFTSDSIVTKQGQTLTAVTNIAIPPIEIEIVDSSHKRDVANNAAVVVATTSSGVLHRDGVVAKTERGVARFLLLKYNGKARDAVLTFTVLQDGAPVHDLSISTGVVDVTQQPIPTSNLAFVADGVSLFTQEAQEYNLESISTPLNVTLALLDSAYQTENVATTDFYVEVTSTMVTVSPTTVRLSPSNQRFEFRKLQITSTSAPESFFLTFTVRNTTLPIAGTALIAGPLRHEPVNGICVVASNEPAVIAELTYTPEEFVKLRGTILQKIGFMMGVDAARVQLLSALPPPGIHGIDQTTGLQWNGCKVKFKFDSPTSTSTNTKSSAELAAEFVKVLPGGVANDINLRSAYYEKDDKSCSVSEFGKAKVSADTDCASMETSNMCVCYSERPVVTTWGKPCQALAEDTTHVDRQQAHSILYELCKTLNDCKDSIIVDVCGNIYQESTTQWMDLLLGPIIFFVLGFVGLVCYRLFVRYRYKLKPTLRDELKSTKKRLMPKLQTVVET